MESAITSSLRSSHDHFAVPLPLRSQRGATDITDPKRNRLLAALSETAFQRWKPRLEAVDMPLGMVVGESGHAQRHVYFPTTSIVALMCDLEDGRTGAVSMVGNEGLVGVAALLGGGGALGRRTVLVAGRGYRVRAADMTVDFEQGGPFTELLLRYTQALITQLAQTVVCNRRHSIENRLCRFLLDTLDRLEGGSDFLVTHELIAGVLGVRREGITEAAQSLQRAGLVHYQRGHVAVLDRAGLAQRSCECHAVVKNEYARLLPPAPSH